MQAKPGDIVIANDEYGDSMVRRLKVKGEEHHLVSDNPLYPNFPVNGSHRIMGVIVESFRRTKY